MENPIKMDDLGVPLFLETPIYFASLKMHQWVDQYRGRISTTNLRTKPSIAVLANVVVLLEGDLDPVFEM